MDRKGADAQFDKVRCMTLKEINLRPPLIKFAVYIKLPEKESRMF